MKFGIELESGLRQTKTNLQGRRGRKSLAVNKYTIVVRDTRRTVYAPTTMLSTCFKIRTYRHMSARITIVPAELLDALGNGLVGPMRHSGEPADRARCGRRRRRRRGRPGRRSAAADTAAALGHLRRSGRRELVVSRTRKRLLYRAHFRPAVCVVRPGKHSGRCNPSMFRLQRTNMTKWLRTIIRSVWARISYITLISPVLARATDPYFVPFDYLPSSAVNTMRISLACIISLTTTSTPPRSCPGPISKYPAVYLALPLLTLHPSHHLKLSRRRLCLPSYAHRPLRSLVYFLIFFLFLIPS